MTRHFVDASFQPIDCADIGIDNHNYGNPGESARRHGKTNSETYKPRTMTSRRRHRMTSYDLSSAHPTEAGSESDERRDARRVAFYPKRGVAGRTVDGVLAGVTWRSLIDFSISPA